MYNEIRIRKSYKTFDELVKCNEFDVAYARQHNIKTVQSWYDRDKDEFIIVVIKDE